MALTTVDLPWATWPMVPMLMVACRLITSGDSAVSLDTSCNIITGVKDCLYTVDCFIMYGKIYLAKLILLLCGNYLALVTVAKKIR